MFIAELEYAAVAEKKRQVDEAAALSKRQKRGDDEVYQLAYVIKLLMLYIEKSF